MAAKREATKRKKLVADDTSDEDAIRLLMQRAFLTRALCREWKECDGRHFSNRCLSALTILDGWLKTNVPGYDSVTGTGSEGLEAMRVPNGYEEIFREIEDGTTALRNYIFWTWADTYDADRDQEIFKSSLEDYWRIHEKAASEPNL